MPSTSPEWRRGATSKRCSRSSPSTRAQEQASVAVSIASSFKGLAEDGGRRAYPGPRAASSRPKKRRTSPRSRVVGMDGRLFRKTRP